MMSLWCSMYDMHQPFPAFFFPNCQAEKGSFPPAPEHQHGAKVERKQRQLQYQHVSMCQHRVPEQNGWLPFGFPLGEARHLPARSCQSRWRPHTSQSVLAGHEIRKLCRPKSNSYHLYKSLCQATIMRRMIVAWQRDLLCHLTWPKTHGKGAGHELSGKLRTKTKPQKLDPALQIAH